MKTAKNKYTFALVAALVCAPAHAATPEENLSQMLSCENFCYADYEKYSKAADYYTPDKFGVSRTYEQSLGHCMMFCRAVLH